MELSAKLYEEMAKRAKHFLRISSYDVATGRYDIALFHIEQAVQLALKAYLFRVFGDFPKTHSVKELIDLSENECLKRLSEDKWYVIDILEDAYIGGRYFIRRYGEKEYREAEKFAEGVFECTGISNI
ncbi:MAG: HEPN domain-containing protein [Archaeoglobus sp.]|jgi:HEPN domain-containing protein|nr:HEPN domain-containing protein [Archaeoglobus sp.]